MPLPFAAPPIVSADTSLRRGVYSGVAANGHPFYFVVRSDGSTYLGVHLPEGLPEHEVLARLYLRLANDDPEPPPRLHLVK